MYNVYVFYYLFIHQYLIDLFNYHNMYTLLSKIKHKMTNYEFFFYDFIYTYILLYIILILKVKHKSFYVKCLKDLFVTFKYSLITIQNCKHTLKYPQSVRQIN